MTGAYRRGSALEMDSPSLMLTTNPFDDDKLKEECGIFGIWGADAASSFVALGLHALQHRGQEAAGITSFDGSHFHSHRAMGHVAGNFDRDDIIRKLAGPRGDRPCPLFDHRRDRAAQRPALVRRACRGRLRGRPQRQSLERDDAARGAQPARLDLPVDQRHRGHHPPRRDLDLHRAARPADRRAEAGRGRLFAGRA